MYTEVFQGSPVVPRRLHSKVPEQMVIVGFYVRKEHIAQSSAANISSSLSLTLPAHFQPRSVPCPLLRWVTQNLGFTELFTLPGLLISFFKKKKVR